MEKQTYIVRYTGNHRGDIQTPKWIGSIFRVKDRDESWDVVEALYKARPFDLDPLPSFYKYNAEIVPGYEAKPLEDELFELE